MSLQCTWNLTLIFQNVIEIGSKIFSKENGSQLPRTRYTWNLPLDMNFPKRNDFFPTHFTRFYSYNKTLHSVTCFGNIHFRPRNYRFYVHLYNEQGLERVAHIIIKISTKKYHLNTTI